MSVKAAIEELRAADSDEDMSYRELAKKTPRVPINVGPPGTRHSRVAR
jgi:hypothetical protein